MQTAREVHDTSMADLPAWKRELIKKKRASSQGHSSGQSCVAGRSLDSFAVSAICTTTPQSNPPQQSDKCSQQGHQLYSYIAQGPASPVRSVEALPRSLSVDLVAAESKCVNSSGGERVKSVYQTKYDLVTSDAGESFTSIEMHHKALGNSRSSNGVLRNSEHEEFEYGPGIVSRLKDRYLSLAMKETKARSTLRKFSSLEDLLDDEAPWPERGRHQTKVRAAPRSNQVKRDVMKRTRSVDSLSYRRQESQEKLMPKSRSSGVIRQPHLCALEKQDVIIIEMSSETKSVENHCVENRELFVTRKTSTSSLLDEDELPQPHTVRQTKQIFENNSPRCVRGTAAAKVAAYKAAQPVIKAPRHPGVKPAIKAKPAILCNNNKGAISPLESVRSPWNGAATGVKPVLVRPTPPPPPPPVPSPYAKKPVAMGRTPVTASVTAPLVNGEADKPVTEPTTPPSSAGVDCTDRGQSILTKPRAVSPVPANLPASPPSSHKINIPCAFNRDLDSSKENQRVLHENRKNSDKSTPFREVYANCNDTLAPCKPTEALEQTIIPTPPPEPVKCEPAPEPHQPHQPRDTPSPPAKVMPKTRPQDPSNNTVMFNFTKRSETPSYIENDGLDMSKRKQMRATCGYVIMPGYEGPADSSTDADADDEDRCAQGASAEPCNVSFSGDGVIINGRSNLQRQPRNKKLEISFDLVSTSIHEYPSENSVLEESEESDFFDENTPLSSCAGGLASYTPSKLLQLSDSFQLGVSKSPHSPIPPRDTAPAQPLMLDHLRPADDSEIVPWSSESAPDLLF